MNAEFIDVHDELARAQVTRFHWRLAAILGALTLFDGYDTFNPAYVIPLCNEAMGSEGGPSWTTRFERTHRILDWRRGARFDRRADPPAGDIARWAMCGQYLRSDDFDPWGVLLAVLHNPFPHCLGLTAWS